MELCGDVDDFDECYVVVMKCGDVDEGCVVYMCCGRVCWVFCVCWGVCECGC